jgi:UDP:flavonoid glycosyltransferase YjiC (YdhE family)
VLAVASRLRSLGHEIELVVPSTFAADARQLGVTPGVYPMDIAALSRKMQRSARGMAQVFRWFLEGLAANGDILLAHTRDPDILLTSSAELHAPTVAEALGIPHYRMAFAPILPGSQTPPVLPLPELPPLLSRAAWFAMNEGMFLALGHHLNRYRRRLGLSRVTSMSEYLNRRCCTLLAISPTLSPAEPSWGWTFHHTGYAFAEEPGAALPPDVERFLEERPRPIYLGFGSMNIRDPRRFACILRQAVRRAGVRLVLDRGWGGLEVEPSDRILSVGELPHRRLFPCLAGVCHHGGAGTTHAAAHAGVPQLVMPYGIDQFYWGRRAHQLGLGPRPMPPHGLDIDTLARGLWELTTRDDFRCRAGALARQLRTEHGTRAAAALIVDHFTARGAAGSC